MAALAERRIIPLDEHKAAITAELLVLTDMLGRSTHGLAQCDAYLKGIALGDGRL